MRRKWFRHASHGVTAEEWKNAAEDCLTKRLRSSSAVGSADVHGMNRSLVQFSLGVTFIHGVVRGRSSD